MKKLWEYYDFFHHPYKPINSTVGKLSSDVLLHNSLLKSSYKKNFLLITKKIRDAIGLWSTVWGVKLDQGILTWELYFYKQRLMNSDRVASNLFKAMHSYFETPIYMENNIECQPYFMFSVDLNDDAFRSKQIDGIHLYLEGEPGVSQGNSFYWGHDGMCLENCYYLFQMPQKTKQFIYKVENIDLLRKHSSSFLKHDLVRELLSCGMAGIAQKKNKVGIYFSRINVVQLLYFLEYFSYPDYIVDFIKARKEKLDHLLYDVAFDCTLGPKGLVFGKSSYYGIF